MKYKFLFSIAISVLLSGAVSAQIVQANLQPASKGYLLRPGDEISVKVLGEKDFDFVATLDEDGKIEVLEKVINARCRTEGEVTAEIKTAIGKYLRNPQMSLQVTKRTIIPATVYGEVYTPKEIELRRKATLVEVLAVTGGVKEEAGGMIQIFRTQKPVCIAENDEGNWKSESSDPTDVPSRMYSLSNVKLGKEEANPIIYPGDVIVVHKAAPVYITGEVFAPQGIYLKEGGTTLTEAIAKVSGFRREAKTKDVRILRLKPNSKDREVIAANYDLIKKGQQKDIVLQPYDIVEVDVKKDSLGISLLKFAIGLAKTTATAASTGGGYRAVIY